MQKILQRLSSAKQVRRGEEVLPLRYRFCSVWSTDVQPPAGAQAELSGTPFTLQLASFPLGGRDVFEVNWATSLSDPLLIVAGPPVVVCHLNELAQVAARMQCPFIAVNADVVLSGGELEYISASMDAFVVFWGDDARDTQAQYAIAKRFLVHLREMYSPLGVEVALDSFLPKFSARAEWSTGEKLLPGQYHVLKLKLNAYDYEFSM